MGHNNFKGMKEERMRGETGADTDKQTHRNWGGGDRSEKRKVHVNVVH